MEGRVRFSPIFQGRTGDIYRSVFPFPRMALRIMSPEMLKIAYVCVRLLKRKKLKALDFFRYFLDVTDMPEEGVEPTLTVK
jgi:hypothetical protein